MFKSKCNVLIKNIVEVISRESRAQNRVAKSYSNVDFEFFTNLQN